LKQQAELWRIIGLDEEILILHFMDKRIRSLNRIWRVPAEVVGIAGQSGLMRHAYPSERMVGNGMNK
jgi:hypothetical protein